MNVQQVSTQNFKGLDFSRVAHADRSLVYQWRKELETIGKTYDIRISSFPDYMGDFKPMMEVMVKEKSEGKNWFQRLRRKSAFTQFSPHGADVLEQTRRAVIMLRAKILNK